MGADLYLVRWLRKILGLRFTYAAPNKTYNIKLSTIIENSGVTLRDRLSDNLKAIEQALRPCPMSSTDSRSRRNSAFTPNRQGARARRRQDHHPADARVHHRADENQRAREPPRYRRRTEDGSIVVEPRREEHPSLLDYERAKDAFQAGRPIKPR